MCYCDPSKRTPYCSRCPSVMMEHINELTSVIEEMKNNDKEWDQHCANASINNIPISCSICKHWDREHQQQTERFGNNPRMPSKLFEADCLCRPTAEVLPDSCVFEKMLAGDGDSCLCFEPVPV